MRSCNMYVVVFA